MKSKMQKTAKKSKKSQTEVVGLMIIVVMITMILLFSVKFMFKKKNPQIKTAERQNLASSFVNAMLKTSSQCSEDLTVKDVLVDCVKSFSGYSTPKCKDNENKCDFAKKELKKILDTTFNKWDKTYEFKLTSNLTGNNVLIHLSNGNNTVAKSGDITDQPLSVLGSEMHVILCMGSCG